MILPLLKIESELEYVYLVQIEWSILHRDS